MTLSRTVLYFANSSLSPSRRFMEEILFLNASHFILILARLLAMCMTAPIFAGRMVPFRWRALFAFAAALLLAPHQIPETAYFQSQLAWTDPGFLAAFGAELLLGLAMGAAVLFFFAALQIAGAAAAYLGGISFPVDAGISNDAAPVTASFFYLLGIAAVFASGGHLLIMDAILQSFNAYPPGCGPEIQKIAQELPSLFFLGFQIGVQMALPILTVILTAQIGLAILNRVFPQLDVFAAAFPVSVLVLLFILSLTLGLAICLFQDSFAEVWKDFFPFGVPR
ncbi:MAG: flagellar biosynthetic protein FliR [Thermoguttaceae bacterium]|nr:flagellar biosynthetic protein FliR [Thermoguttaceae bacterium]